MSALPPRERLALVADSLVRRLPEQLSVLLSAERFADGRAAIERLSAPGATARAAAGLPPEEAQRLADLLLERWASVGEVQLDPAAAITGPEEVWASEQPGPVPYEIATLGVGGDWTAEWTGDATPDEGGRRALLEVPVPAGDGEVLLRLQARVFARAAGRRQVLVAERTVRVRAHRDGAGACTAAGPVAGGEGRAP
jgi:hypothetical protein